MVKDFYYLTRHSILSLEFEGHKLLLLLLKLKLLDYYQYW